MAYNKRPKIIKTLIFIDEKFSLKWVAWYISGFRRLLIWWHIRTYPPKVLLILEGFFFQGINFRHKKKLEHHVHQKHVNKILHLDYFFTLVFYLYFAKKKCTTLYIRDWKLKCDFYQKWSNYNSAFFTYFYSKSFKIDPPIYLFLKKLFI